MPRKKKEPEIIVEEEISLEEAEDIINDDGLDDGIELPPQAEEKLQELIDLGKKKKNVLELSEVADFLNEVNLDDDQLSHVMDVLAQHEIDILSISENDPDADDDQMDDLDDDAEIEEEEVDLDNIEGFIPEGVSLRTPSACISKRSVKFRSSAQMRRSNLLRPWKEAEKKARKPRRNWLRRISGLLFP